MNSLAAIIPVIALVFPMAVAELPEGSLLQASAVNEAVSDAAPRAPDGPLSLPSRALEEARRTPEANQVRIEQRVIIRIAPSTPRAAAQSLPRLAEDIDRFEEQRMGECVPISTIAAVQPAEDNRLLLFTRDRRVLSAALEKSCNSEDFYLGFYVERSADGQLCTRRDKLQSRAGASCRFTRLSRLVAEKD